MEAKYLTIKEAAKLLGVSPLTLRNWDKKGVLVAYRHPANNYRLYRYADVEDFLRRLRQSRPSPSVEPEPTAGPSSEIQKLPVTLEDDLPSSEYHDAI